MLSARTIAAANSDLQLPQSGASRLQWCKSGTLLTKRWSETDETFETVQYVPISTVPTINFAGMHECKSVENVEMGVLP